MRNKIYEWVGFIIAFVIIMTVYILGIMPIRRHLCTKYDMTAVWYIHGCVNNKEIEK